MTRRFLAFGMVLALASSVSAESGRAASTAPAQDLAQPASVAEVGAAIDKRGSFDLPVRLEASRTVRRAATAVAVPALTRAVRDHADGYVRYRALVLLAGFGDASAADVMREIMSDRNDR